MEYGEKISYLRKTNGVTQAELGAALNVTFQAVSKWERGESYPDFETLSKIAKYFGVPISYFEDGETVDTYAPAPAPVAAPVPAREKIGACTCCGKDIYSEDELAYTTPKFICHSCAQRQAEAKKQADKQRIAEAEKKVQRDKEYEKYNAKRIRNRGLIVAGAIMGTILLFLIIGVIMDPTDAGAAFGGYAIITLFLFPFIAQLFWHGFIVDVVLCGGKILGGIGVLFTLDLDGIIFLIIFKLIWFVIKILFFILTIIFFTAIAIIMSPFTFVPAVIKLSKGHELN